MTMTIIGGGIGGLTTAIALQQSGFTVTVYEAADTLRPLGAGIILANNAMQVYQNLGLAAEISEKGVRIDQLRITDPKLAPLSISDLTSFEKQSGVHNVAIHRADLQAILLRALNSNVNLQLGKKLQRIARNDQQTTLHFTDGTSAGADVVIGADGIRSMVREYVHPNSLIRQPKQACWRGVVNYCLPAEHLNKLQESWGRGIRFGFTQINANHVYWYALLNYKEDYKQEFANIDLATWYESFHPIVAELIRLTPPHALIANEIIDLKPIPSWFSGNIALIGDAAHATTPNLGQGACQAIEDAYLLANLWAKHTDYNVVFPRFHTLRKNKVEFVVNTSWQLGKLAHIEHSWGCGARNILMRLMPNSMANIQNKRLFTLDKVD